ncbi:fatty acid desaturase family protein [Archangium primigenium]|uniref:fatty acid desaturase family protein n=1 Tax=[Archangium] primigenium TaxID=2792470 RepID=UPI00308432E8
MIAPSARESFVKELQTIKSQLESTPGEEDLRHLQKMSRWGRLSAVLGYATAWLAPNPLSAWLIAQGMTARWTIVAHHVLHRGYERVAQAPDGAREKTFARGWRRAIDWLDWIHPQAWSHEHNVLHHGHTGETKDPDLVERRMKWLRTSRIPMALRYVIVAILACTWRLTYYAPSTFLEWRWAKKRLPEMDDEDGPFWMHKAFDPRTADGRAFWWMCLLPYASVRFVLAPLLFLPLGRAAALAVLFNSLLAEVFANLQSFVLIAPNHAGEDIYRFEERTQGRADYCVRQILGSTNYTTGGDVLAFLHGGLNYQIEHHLWPGLSLLQLQRSQARVQALCERYGLPYVQENVFRRTRKAVHIMVGRHSMLRLEGAAEEDRARLGRVGT